MTASVKIFTLFFGIFVILSGTAFPEGPATGQCLPSQYDLEGPYYLSGAPLRSDIAGPDEPGQRIIIKGKVLTSDCRTPVSEALIEIWQTGADGEYHYREEGFRLRGQINAGIDGHYSFSTIKPGRYGLLRGFRPAHIHMKVTHPEYEPLITQLYFKGDPYLWPQDACGRGCKSNDPHRIIELDEKKGVLQGTFNIILTPAKK